MTHPGIEIRARLPHIKTRTQSDLIMMGNSDLLHLSASWAGAMPNTDRWAEMLPPVLDPVLNTPLFVVEYRAVFLPDNFGDEPDPDRPMPFRRLIR